MLLDVRRNRDWFDVFKVSKTTTLAPIEKLTDGVIVRGPSAELESPRRDVSQSARTNLWNQPALGLRMPDYAKMARKIA